MKFKLFFKRKSDQSEVKSLKQLYPKNLKKDESAEIFRIESNTKTDYETRVCKWIIGEGKSFSYPYLCYNEQFPTQKAMTSFIAKKLKRKVMDIKDMEIDDELVGRETENYQFPSELDLEFDHDKIKKYRKD